MIQVAKLRDLVSVRSVYLTITLIQITSVLQSTHIVSNSINKSIFANAVLITILFMMESVLPIAIQLRFVIQVVDFEEIIHVLYVLEMVLRCEQKMSKSQ